MAQRGIILEPASTGDQYQNGFNEQAGDTEKRMALAWIEGAFFRPALELFGCRPREGLHRYKSSEVQPCHTLRQA